MTEEMMKKYYGIVFFILLGVAVVFAQSSNVAYIGSYDTSSFALGVYVSGNYAYVANDNSL